MRLFPAYIATLSFNLSCRTSFLRANLASALTHIVSFFVRLMRPWSREDDTLARHECHSWCDSTEREINYDILTARQLRS
jgi:hypothetical protein